MQEEDAWHVQLHGSSIAKLREHLDNRGKVEVTARNLYLSIHIL